jgi:hypothetical protein
MRGGKGEDLQRKARAEGNAHILAKNEGLKNKKENQIIGNPNP